jgi:hypothetical protein
MYALGLAQHIMAARPSISGRALKYQWPQPGMALALKILVACSKDTCCLLIKIPGACSKIHWPLAQQHNCLNSQHLFVHSIQGIQTVKQINYEASGL